MENSDQVKTWVAYFLLGEGFLTELLLAFRPQQAASHFSQALDATTTQMMRGLGYSHMSTTMTAVLMMMTSQKPMQAVAWGTLPRVLYVASLLANPNPASELNAKDLIPPYAIILACCGLGLWKESWAKRCGQVIAGIYLAAGLGIALAPKWFAKTASNMDLSPPEKSRD